MTVLTFNGYSVAHCEYTRNDNFNNSNERIDMSHILESSITIKEDNAEIDLSISVGSLTENNQPFKVDILLTGFFSYSQDNDENSIGFENLLKVNGTAILYPYLRALVSSITNLSGEYPGYNMPTININKALQSENLDSE